MNILFLMDPLETVNYKKDTTLMLMIAASRKRHKVFYVPKNGISYRSSQVIFDALEVVPQKNKTTPFRRLKNKLIKGPDADVVFIRPDPPFDQDYLTNTWLLDLLPRQTLVINNPNGIRAVNEKLIAAHFSDLTPETIVTSRLDFLSDFVSLHNEVIAKPLNGFGGKSIFYVKKNDLNRKVILETLTQNGRQKIILQRYIPAAKRGDKRILLLNGEPLGAILRVHAKGDHRNNFFSGGKPVPVQITPRDRHIIDRLRPKLIELGLYFVGIDIIGDYLIEVNVTSPTCLQEMNRAYGQHLEDRVIDFCQNLIDQGDS